MARTSRSRGLIVTISRVTCGLCPATMDSTRGQKTFADAGWLYARQRTLGWLCPTCRLQAKRCDCGIAIPAGTSRLTCGSIECIRARARKKHSENRDKILKKTRERYAQRRDEINAKRRAEPESVKERQRAAARKRYARLRNDPEWSEKTRKASSDYYNRRKDDPEWKQKRAESANARTKKKKKLVALKRLSELSEKIAST